MIDRVAHPPASPPDPSAMSPNALPRLTGVLYAVIIVLGLFAELAVRSTIRVPGNPGITAPAIQEDPLLVQIGFVASLGAEGRQEMAPFWDPYCGAPRRFPGRWAS